MKQFFLRNKSYIMWLVCFYFNKIKQLYFCVWILSHWLGVYKGQAHFCSSFILTITLIWIWPHCYVLLLVTQSCPTFCDPKGYSLPGSSVSRILQARILAAAAAKSLQPCPTLCDPGDGSPPGSAIPGILQARTLEWVAISFSNA